MKTYYRLLCLQGTGYMGTGYNSNSLEELAEDYASYKSNDWDNGDYLKGEETMHEVWNKMKLEDKINYIKNDEFEIETSSIPFNENEIH